MSSAAIVDDAAATDSFRITLSTKHGHEAEGRADSQFEPFESYFDAGGDGGIDRYAEERRRPRVGDRGSFADMASWAGQPAIKGSSETMRMALLTFSLIGVQYVFCSASCPWGSRDQVADEVMCGIGLLGVLK